MNTERQIGALSLILFFSDCFFDARGDLKFYTDFLQLKRTQLLKWLRKESKSVKGLKNFLKQVVQVDISEEVEVGVTAALPGVNELEPNS